MQCHRLLTLSNGNSCYNEISSTAVTISNAGRGRGIFASVPDDSFFEQSHNNKKKKIKEIGSTPGKNIALNL